MMKTLYCRGYKLKNLLKILAYFSLATFLLYQGFSNLSAQIPNNDLKTVYGIIITNHN